MPVRALPVMLIGLTVCACSWFADDCEPSEKWCDGDFMKKCRAPDEIERENCADYGATCIEEEPYVYCGYPEVDCDPTAEFIRHYCFGSYLASCSTSAVPAHPTPVNDCQEQPGVSCIEETGYQAEYHDGAYCGFSDLDCPDDLWGDVCVGDARAICRGSEHPMFAQQCSEHDYDIYCVESEPYLSNETSYTKSACAYHPDTCEPGDQACSPDVDFLWLSCLGYAYTMSYRCAPGLVCVEEGPYGVSCE